MPRRVRRTFAKLLEARGEDGSAFGGHDDEDDDRAFDAHARKRTSEWAASVAGFSVHAGTAVATDNRVGLEKLVRYCARPAVSLERLSRMEDGRFAVRVTHPIGTKTHRVMEPMELMARLASLVAPPRYPLVRYVGLFAPGCRDRARVVPGRAPGPPRCCAAHAQPTPAPTAAATAATDATVANTRTPDALLERPAARAGENTAPACGVIDVRPATTPAPTRARLPGGTRAPWALLMKHAFDGLDVLTCRSCGSRMEIVAVVQDVSEVRRYLAHARIAVRDGAPSRAWDPVPIDEVFVETGGARDPCTDEMPDDDWTA